MTTATLQSKIRGCVFGAALGDAVGAPFEFRSAKDVSMQTGGTWIDGLYPFKRETGPHGVWQSEAPLGTGTDDTRYNWLFLELASKLRRMPTAEEIAGRFIDVYENPTAFFGEAPNLASRQFESWQGACRGCLGQASRLHPGVPPAVLRDRSIGLNYPTLIGLITLTSAGLLFPGKPEEAYKAAFRADFIDVGYARECVAILAAAISAAVCSEGRDAHAVLATAAVLNPYDLGGCFGGPFAVEKLRAFLQATPKDATPHMLAERLSQELAHLHPFDPYKTLAIAFAASALVEDDALSAILVAVNHRGIADSGKLSGFQDIDCYGTVTGAIAGALAGEEAFPQDMIHTMIESNRTVYGFDLAKSVDHFVESTCAQSAPGEADKPRA